MVSRPPEHCSLKSERISHRAVKITITITITIAVTINNDNNNNIKAITITIKITVMGAFRSTSIKIITIAILKR